MFGFSATSEIVRLASVVILPRLAPPASLVGLDEDADCIVDGGRRGLLPSFQFESEGEGLAFFLLGFELVAKQENGSGGLAEDFLKEVRGVPLGSALESSLRVF